MRDHPLQNARIFLLAVVVGSASCSTPTSPALPLPKAPAPVTPPVAAPVPRVYPQIAAGQTVTDVLGRPWADNGYELTAPRDGMLRVTVSWDSNDGVVSLLVGSKQFGSELGNPRIGEITVVAGQKYLITIADGDPWDSYYLNLPYTFKTSIH
jgi:hypothetical protein